MQTYAIKSFFFFFTCAMVCVLKEAALMSGGVWTCGGLGGNK